MDELLTSTCISLGLIFVYSLLCIGASVVIFKMPKHILSVCLVATLFIIHISPNIFITIFLLWFFKEIYNAMGK